MIYLHFFVDNERYVISVDEISEIVPLVTLKKQASLPDYIAGLLNYHGEAFPVVDLCQLLLNRASRKKLSSRIVVAEGVDIHGTMMRIGVLVERATDMISLDESSFKQSSLKNSEAITDGKVTVYQDELVTCIAVKEIIEKIDRKLFPSISGEAQEACP